MTKLFSFGPILLASKSKCVSEDYKKKFKNVSLKRNLSKKMLKKKFILGNNFLLKII